MDGYLAGGGTRKDLAKALGTSPSSVTRHLQGKRITPRKQLRAIKAHLFLVPVLTGHRSPQVGHGQPVLELADDLAQLLAGRWVEVPDPVESSPHQDAVDGRGRECDAVQPL